MTTPNGDGRDYVAEMQAVIDAETAQTPYAAPTVAEHIVNKLRTTDPDLLRGWLDTGAVGFLRHAINLRDCARRTHNRATASRSVFRRAAEEFESGNPEPITTRFMTEVYVTEDGSKVALGEMRQLDLRFAADDFARRARENALQEAFLRALAKKVGDGRVSDVFDEQRLAEMWRSISGGTQ